MFLSLVFLTEHVGQTRVLLDRSHRNVFTGLLIKSQVYGLVGTKPFK